MKVKSKILSSVLLLGVVSLFSMAQDQTENTTKTPIENKKRDVSNDKNVNSTTAQENTKQIPKEPVKVKTNQEAKISNKDENFNPTEQISEDLAVSYPVDI